MEKALATADFRIHGTDWNGKQFESAVHAGLYKSGSFAYGNGTCMVFEWSNGNDEVFDTRYDRVTPDTFTEFAMRVLRGKLKKDVAIDVVKGE